MKAQTHEPTLVTFAPTGRPRQRVSIAFEGQGKTHQEFKEECDVNTIVRQWRRTAHCTHLNQMEPFYGDFTNANDYLEAVQNVENANLAFLGLPADVRDLCGNSPAKFMSMAENEGDLAKLVEAGLTVKDGEDPPPSKPAPKAAKEAELPPATPSEGS